jgi:ATP-dependent helicase/nuclease subunit B
MAVRFIIGRAGTGKTHHCLQSVRRHLRESPVDGGRLILLVPEQASLQTERALLDDPQIGATVRAEVLSFRRLAFRILQGAAAPQRTALSSNGRAMVLRRLVAALADRLTYYRRAGSSAGFLEHLSRTITELIDEAVTPDALDGLAGDGHGDPLRVHKINDLRVIYRAYLEYLGIDKLDPSQQLELARERITRCEWLIGATIWVDGFAGFTRQQVLMLTEMAKIACRIEITAMIDPAYAMQAGDATPVEPGDLFAKTQRTYLDLRRAFVEAGVPVETPRMLSPSPPPRFAESGELARLERSLFAEPGREAGEPSDVSLVQAADRRTEVDYVVSLICHLVHTAGGELRYRDVAVILRDLEPYHDLLSAALSERRIPFFIDRRRPTSHHPVVELMRGLASLAATSFSLESVRMLLKTGLLGLDDADADELENYLLAHGLEGEAVWRQQADWAFAKGSSPANRDPDRAEEHQRRLQRVNRTRRTFLDRVQSWYDAARSDPVRNGRQWAERLVETLEQLQVAPSLSDWARQAEDDGDLDLAEQHRQIGRDIAAFLNDFSLALGDETMNVAALCDVLSAGLSQLTLGLAPPMLDQVLVGSIERSRHPEIKVAIVMGFNEGLFPPAGSEDSILNDDDRKWLANRGVHVGVTRRQRVLDEPLLAYTALTRASRRVIATCAAADEEGQALRPSPFVAALKAAVPGLAMPFVDHVDRGRRPWSVHTSRDLAARLALEFRTRPPSARDDRPTRTLWNDLYEASRRAEGMGEGLRPALSALTYENAATLTPESVARWVAEPLRASVSRLETFAACPFQHFAKYGLRLEERELAELADVDVGTIHHAILEQFVERVAAQRQSLAEMDEAEVRSLLHASWEAVTASVTSGGPLSSARDAYVLRRSETELARVLSAQQRVARSGKFRPRRAEVKFGFDEPDSWPALEITTPKKRQVRLRGFIDRVDLAELADQMLGVVIDYKRTRDRRLDLSHVYHGLSLQLLGYLLVLAERGESLAGRPVQPVGAFYISLVETYTPVDHPDQAQTAEEQTGGTFAPRGVLSAEHIGALDSEFSGSGRSKLYNVYVKKDGTLGHADRTDAAGREEFAALLDYTRHQVGELADGILDGDVSVSPYRLRGFSPCSWCEYGSVCRFEFGTSRVRDLEPLSRTAVLARIAQRR